MYSSRFDDLPPSPFRRLEALISGTAPGDRPIDMSIGQPGHPLPDFIQPLLAEHNQAFSRYPPAQGLDRLRSAIADWIERRYAVAGAIDPATQIIPVCGSREALFTIAPVVVAEHRSGRRPAVLMPNPFYQTYATAAVAAGAEPVLLPATAQTGHLPDLDAVPEDLWERTSAFYLCSPANPQGAVASLAYLKQAIGLARTHGFVLLMDECYSEVYAGTPPPGAVQAAAQLGDGMTCVLIFNSLSKRSNLAGMRSGFCVGDAEIIASYLKFRNLAAPQMPLPVQEVSAAVWADEGHVDASRALYREKYRLVAEVLGGVYAHAPPEAGMFLWFDSGRGTDSEATALRLWRDAGIKVVPGNYLALDMASGINPGSGYVRIALVHDLATTRDALNRIAATM